MGRKIQPRFLCVTLLTQWDSSFCLCPTTNTTGNLSLVFFRLKVKLQNCSTWTLLSNHFGSKWLTWSTNLEIGPALSKNAEAIILEKQATVLSFRAIVPRQCMSAKTALFFTFHLIGSDFASNQVSQELSCCRKRSVEIDQWKCELQLERGWWLCWTTESVAQR